MHSLSAAGSSLARRAWLPAAVLLHAVLAISYLTTVPAFNWPDEPAHLSYILHIADGHGLPVMSRDAWSAAELEGLKRDHFAGVGPRDPRITGVRYEAHQPPLSYLAAALLFRLTGSVTAVRLLNLLLSCAVVILTALFARAVFPEERWLPAVAAFVVALQPMRCAMAVSVGNDPAAELLWACLLLAMAKGTRALWMGVLIGGGLLVKAGAVLAIPLYGAWLVIVGPREAWLRRTATATMAALVVASPWLARNVALYGWRDPLAISAGALGFEGVRPHLALLGEHGIAPFLWRTFQSWWGTFGWMEMAPDGRALAVYLAISVAAGAGLMVFALRRRRAGTGWSSSDRKVLWIVLAHLVVLAALTAYSRFDLQAQGRYLLVLSPASALLIALALEELTDRWLPLAAATGGLALLWVNLLNLRHVIPWYLAR